MLTAFLGRGIRADTAFQKSLDNKIDRAIVELENLIAFWEVHTSSTIRRQNLRLLLLHASKAGSLLFQQPSFFMFDWSHQAGAYDRTVVVTPALRRHLDEQGRMLSQEGALLESVQAALK